ncbi:DEAD/DEAH box helicase, partial [Candidatus Woesearchaeota archaeon]|nr:DEAD/DEAH box helicase [Candidatus Woesearchaeota archaeon]
MVRFEDFPLKPEILRALKEMGFEEPTEIQEKSLSFVLDGEDVIGASKTGSGKTAAFGVPLLNYIEDGYGLQVLILAPTRELAVQIAGEMEKFSEYLDVNVATIYGGVAYEPQLEAMKTAHILVATPGRLLDHLQQGNFDLGGIFSFVLDEADKMVEMGFVEDIEEIMGYGPGDEQMLLFGATIAGEIERIKNEYMRSPKVVEAERYVEESMLQQYYYNLQPYEKFSMLVHLLNQESFDRAIVFCSSRATVDDVSDNLTRQGFKNVKIHGKLAQASRLKMLERFNKGEVPIL